MRLMALGGAGDLPPALSLSQLARDLPDSPEALPRPNPPFFLALMRTAEGSLRLSTEFSAVGPAHTRDRRCG